MRQIQNKALFFNARVTMYYAIYFFQFLKPFPDGVYFFKTMKI